MNYLFKLVKRLAGLDARLIIAIALCACAPSDSLDPTSNSADSHHFHTYPVASVAVSPTSASPIVGTSTRFTAITMDQYGNVLTSQPVRWSTSDSTIATVDQNGMANAVRAGTATITATSNSEVGQAVVNATVASVPNGTPGTVTDLVVSAVNDTSATLSFTQVGDGNGQPASYEVRDGPWALTWASATDVSRGTCVPPLAGTTISANLKCTVLGLVPGTVYTFQLEAFRGTWPGTPTMGAPSNAATTSTTTQTVTASVSVSPTSATLTAGQTVQFSASALNLLGTVLTGKTVTWSSSNAAVVTVSASGLATGVAAGSASITATIDGTQAQAAITVGSSGGTNPVAPSTVTDLRVVSTTDTSATLAFTQVSNGAGAVASFDTRFAVAPMSWGSASTVVQGTCTSPLAGTTVGATMTCSVYGLTPATTYNFQTVAFRGTLNVNAVFGSLSNVAAGTTPGVPPVVTTLTLAPTSASVGVGSTSSLSATVKDQSGNTMSGQTVSWSSSNMGIATVNASGVVTGVAAGSVTITASDAGKIGTASVTVTAITPVVTTVLLAPTSTSVTAGSTASLSATVKDQSGNTMSGQTVSWSSSNTGVATVNASGVVTGVAAGSVTITASDAGMTGTASVTVTAVAPVVTTVTVSPASASVTAGSTTPLSATVKDQNGNTMSGQTVSWSSNNTGIATVNASGVVTGVAAGSATITASDAGKTGTASVTVTAVAPVVTTVTVAPTSASVATGSTTSLSATVKDQNGNTMSGQTVSWSSNNTGIATVNASGVVTGVAAGSATITASDAGKTGTASVTVSGSAPPPTSNEPAGVTVYSDNSFTHTIPIGQSVPITGESPWYINNGGLASLIPGGGMQYLYQLGINQGGGSPATAFMDAIPSTANTMYVRAVWEATSPWTPSPNGHNKILYLGMASSGDMYMMLDGQGPYTISVETELPNDVRNFTGTVNLTLGTSHTLEWIVQYGPSGGSSADGIVKWWVDGVLQGTVTNVGLPSGGFGEFQLYGGTGLTIPLQNQYYYYYNVHVSGKP